MTIEYVIPGRSSSQSLPTREDLPFPRAQVVAWCSGKYVAKTDTTVTALVDRKSAAVYALAPTPSRYESTVQNGIDVISHTGGSNFSPFTGAPLSELAQFQSAEKITLYAVARRGNMGEESGSGVYSLFRADADNFATALARVGYRRNNGALEFVAGFHADGGTLEYAILPVAANTWETIKVVADFKTKVVSLSIGDQTASAALGGEGDSWTLSEAAKIRVLGAQALGFLGEFADLVMLTGDIPGQTAAMIEAFCGYKARTLNL